MKVLIAVDVSAAGEGLLDAVARRIWPDKTEFHLISVIEQTTGQFASEPYRTGEELELYKNAISDKLLGFMASLKHKMPHATISGDVVVGGAVESIVREAREVEADLIIVGHQGGYGQGGYSLGGVAERIVQRAPCSVIIVKPKVRVEPVASEMMQGATV